MQNATIFLPVIYSVISGVTLKRFCVCVCVPLTNGLKIVALLIFFFYYFHFIFIFYLSFFFVLTQSVFKVQ